MPRVEWNKMPRLQAFPQSAFGASRSCSGSVCPAYAPRRSHKHDLATDSSQMGLLHTLAAVQPKASVHWQRNTKRPSFHSYLLGQCTMAMSRCSRWGVAVYWPMSFVRPWPGSANTSDHDHREWGDSHHVNRWCLESGCQGTPTCVVERSAEVGQWSHSVCQWWIPVLSVVVGVQRESWPHLLGQRWLPDVTIS